MKGRMANSAVKRWVIACSSCSARTGCCRPRRATYSPTAHSTQPSSAWSPWTLACSKAAALSKSCGKVASSALQICIARPFISRLSSPVQASAVKRALPKAGHSADSRCARRCTVCGLIRFLKSSAMLAGFWVSLMRPARAGVHGVWLALPGPLRSLAARCRRSGWRGCRWHAVLHRPPPLPGSSADAVAPPC